MPRAIWTGSISFGLLNVPVKLYSAVSKQTVRFRELREKDGSGVRHSASQRPTARRSPTTTSSRATSSRPTNT